jgi:hypothetical protein
MLEHITGDSEMMDDSKSGRVLMLHRQTSIEALLTRFIGWKFSTALRTL